MAIARYLSHPQVVNDPTVPVPQWGLCAVGQARIAALADSDALVGTAMVFSSTETKAVQAALPLAAALCCPLHQVAEMGENDRSATGYLPGSDFEHAANRFFADPGKSYAGWETAFEAQQRILSAINTALAHHTTGDVLFVGHGAVGTLLYCALAQIPIDRQHDQLPGGGNVFCFYIASTQPDGPWRPLETLFD